MAEMNGPRFKFSFGKQVNNVKCASDSVLYCRLLLALTSSKQA